MKLKGAQSRTFLLKSGIAKWGVCLLFFPSNIFNHSSRKLIPQERPTQCISFQNKGWFDGLFVVLGRFMDLCTFDPDFWRGSTTTDWVVPKGPRRTEKEEFKVVGWFGLLTARKKDILSWNFFVYLKTPRLLIRKWKNRYFRTRLMLEKDPNPCSLNVTTSSYVVQCDCDWKSWFFIW